MERDLTALTERTFDVIVIGGGIAGAFIAWDAVLRGYDVALLDAGDFGHATSANSLKIVHGGLRYLQDGNLRRARRMALERQAFFTIAPHLVRPLRAVVPTTRNLKRHPALMRSALLMNDVISFGRNRGSDPALRLPRGKLLRQQAWHDLSTELLLSQLDVPGAAQWYDGQMINSERLTWAVVRGAAEHGARVANYVTVTALRQQNGRVTGVVARDSSPEGDSSPFDVRGRVIINAAGNRLHHLLPGTGAYGVGLAVRPSLAMNVVVDRPFASAALALPTRPRQNGRSRLLFVTPWAGRTVIGTAHLPLLQHDGPGLASSAQIDAFIEEINSALPGVTLTRADITLIHQGVLPAWQQRGHSAEPVRLVREGQVIDHKKDGVDGLLSVLSVKYTGARHSAEKAVDAVEVHLGARNPCTTRTTPIWGADIPAIDAWRAAVRHASLDRLSAGACRRLADNYGSDATRVLALLPLRRRGDLDLLEAQTIFALREEMAQTLTDVILRRTGIGATGIPDPMVTQHVAHLMATELNWSADLLASELNALAATYRALGIPSASFATSQ